MPLQATSGAASYDAFGGGVPVVPAYIEEVFSTYLYTGTGNTQTITNEIDLSTKGGLVWTKSRNAAYDHWLFDTARGVEKKLTTNTSDGQGTTSGALEQFNANGYRLGYTGGGYAELNESAKTYVSWTFRKQPKFFDIVTYTGDGVGDRTISHNLGAVPAVIIIKQTNDTRDWVVRTTVIDGSQDFLFLNKTDAKGDSGISNTWSTTSFTVSSGNFDNGSGNTYVAYLFASNAGGFGLTGTDNVISCGSWTNDGSGNASVTLGYEPQWILWKRSDSTSDWYIFDTMRGWTGDPANTSAGLRPNLTNAENSLSGYAINSTGFSVAGVASASYIYIAIRRGPMKVPTSGTSVFAPSTAVEPQSSALFTAGFSDMTLHKPRLSEGNAPWITDRLRGNGNVLQTPYTSAEATYSTYFKYDSNAGAYIQAGGYYNNSGGGTTPYALYAFKRAPSFFDEVCYTNNASGASEQVNNHNLGVIPELAITKVRNDVNSWYVASNIGSTTFDRSFLDSSAASINLDYVSASTYKGFTSTTFTVGSSSIVGAGGFNVVTYLFATCAGVSKVGSYTGNGSSQTINCGFTGGARFVMIKATSTTGNWIVADSARGIVAGNDPALYLNSTAAEVTGLDWIDADNSGFVVNETATIAANTNGVTYIFLAIA